ncbi:MAG: hypothetical protein NTY38_02555 [Acidobacteria bacterium]|nr:hypothetical protein [Acidobacteriota bacterium]
MTRAVFANWETSGVVSAYAGPPITVADSTDVANTGAGTSSIPLRVANGNLPSSQRTLARWFDVSAFVVQPAFTQGNAGRNIIIGPGLFNVDFAAIKNIPVTERTRVQFRAEFFNFLNHANFGNPNASLGSPSFARVSSAAPGRDIQLGAKIIF